MVVVSQLRHILPVIREDARDWRSPSIRSGAAASLREERQLRCRGCRFIENFFRGLQLTNKQVLLATGFFYFQLFYAWVPYDSEDIGVVSLSCVFLACKVGEQMKKMREILKVYQNELADGESGNRSRGNAGAEPGGFGSSPERTGTSGLSEYESQCLREQIHKVEFFLLRAMDFHLEMPPAEGALMLKIYFTRFRLIFVDGAFNWLFEVDQGEEQGGEAPAQEQPSATSGTVKEKVNKKRKRKLPSGIRVVGEGATWQEKRVRFGFRPTADNNCTPSWSGGSAGDETKCVLPLCGSRNIYRILKEVKGAAAASTLPSTTSSAGAGALSPPEPAAAFSSSQQQHDAAAARAAAHEFWLDNLSEIKVTARNFYTDAFRTFVVLKYLPHKIAIASLFLSIVFRCQKNDELGQKILSWAAVNNFEEEEDENGIKEGTEHHLEDHFSTTNNAATASTTHPTPVSTTTGGTSHAPVGTGGTNPLRGGATALHDAVYELLCFLEPDVERAEIKVIFEEIVAMVGCHQQEKGVLRKPKLQEQKVDEVLPSGSAGSSHAGTATGTRLTQDLRRYAAAARAPVPSVAAKGAGKHRPGAAGPTGNKTPGLLATRSRALPAPPPLPPGAKSISERKNAGATSSSVATASGVAAATSTAQQVIADEKIPRTTLRRKAEESGEDAHVDGGGSRLKQAKFDHENDVKNTERMQLSRQKSFFGASPPGVGRAESSKLGGGAGAAAKSPVVEIEDDAASSNRRSRERERSRHRKSKRRRSDREQPQETGVASSHSRRSRRRRRRPKRHASLLEDVSAERGREHSSLGSADIIRTPADMGGVENDAQHEDAQRDQNMQQRVGASPTRGSAGGSLSRGRRSLASGSRTRRREEVEHVQLPEDGGGEPRDEDEPRRSYSVESSLSSSSSSSSSSGSRGSGSGSGPSHSFSSSPPSSSGKDGVGAVPGRDHEHEHKREPPDAGGGIQGNN